MSFTATVINGSLALRADTSTDSTILCRIPDGTTIPVATIAGDGTWIRATYNNKLGYCMTQYLRLNESDTHYGVAACDRYGAALLRNGSSGSRVSLMQRDLRAIGYTLSIDGVFGDETEAAVKQFQRDVFLTDDGIVGLDTKTYLYGAVTIG